MKLMSHVLTGVLVATVTVGVAEAPAQAQSSIPVTPFTQAVGDAFVEVVKVPSVALEKVTQGTPLQSIGSQISALTMITSLVIASLSSEQCHLGDVRACQRKAHEQGYN